jgi:hypothetical protein
MRQVKARRPRAGAQARAARHPILRQTVRCRRLATSAYISVSVAHSVVQRPEQAHQAADRQVHVRVLGSAVAQHLGGLAAHADSGEVEGHVEALAVAGEPGKHGLAGRQLAGDHGAVRVEARE